MDLPVLTRRRATDEVYDVLRNSILEHRFLPGQRLLVDQISTRLGVSLTPVRHALQQLAAEGLVEIRPRSGTYVASLTESDVSETFQIRRALECLAAETLIEQIREETLKQLRLLVWRLAEPVESDADRTRHEQNNLEFHRLIVEASGNKRLAEMYESLKAHLQIARVHSVSLDEWVQRLPVEQAEHEEILTAIEARDRDQLVRALGNHINRANTALTETLKKTHANL
jgi:DNA-binding GntR family transcriptional regulator